jgi:hypothetical protein
MITKLNIYLTQTTIQFDKFEDTQKNYTQQPTTHFNKRSKKCTQQSLKQ